MTADPLNTIMLREIHQAISDRCIHTKENGGRAPISPSGIPQSWLIDLRRAFLERDTLERIADAFWARFEGRDSLQVGGMEIAAIPLVTAIMLKAPKKMGSVNGFIVRKERKTYGLGNTIEGTLTGAPIVLVDDIVNSGGSIEKACKTVEQAGHSVAEAFVVIDYKSPKGLHWREGRGITVHSLFSLEEFGLSVRERPRLPSQKYRELWKAIVPNGNPWYVVPKSAPVLADGRIYRGCDSGIMHCFDAETGNVVWAFQARGAGQQKGIWSRPCLHDGQLYFGAYNGVVYCLDEKSGKEVWAQSYSEWIGASPIAVAKHGLLYIGLEYERPWGQGSLAALDLKTGLKVWEVPLRKFQHGSPSYWEFGDLIIWGTADHEMCAFKPATGETVWSLKTRRSVKYAPAIDEERGLIAFASFDSSIYAVDAATGTKLGEWETGEICYTTPLIVGNRLFCGSGDRHLYIIDLEKMELIKKIDFRARIYSSPRIIGDRVIFGTNGGRVIELNAETLEVEGNLQLPDAVTNAIAISPNEERIFVSTYMNHLFALERLR